jgi:hypothetical protein
MKRKNNTSQNFAIALGALIFVGFISASIYYMIPFLGNSSEPNYQLVIDSLNRENEKLDSLYLIEYNKKKEVRTLYKKVSIKEELDSLGKLRKDLEKIRLDREIVLDTTDPDSLRLFLMKDFN